MAGAAEKEKTGASCNSSGNSTCVKFPLPLFKKADELKVSAFSSV